MNILIVDDEVLVLSLIKRCIDWKALGIEETFYAYNAKEARSLVEEKEIHIIVCDIEMPQENGLHFLQWVKESHPSIVKIILTGFPDFQYAQNALEIGVFKYLLKPVSFEQLTGAVSAAMKEVRRKEQSGKETEKEVRLPRKEQGESSAKHSVKLVKEYIEAHYAEDISRQDIEEQVHMNEDYINRIFKQETGYTLVQYIQYYRILIAKRLIREQHCSITEAGKLVGFDSPSYFTKIFKKWTNITPNEYCMKHQTNDLDK